MLSIETIAKMNGHIKYRARGKDERTYDKYRDRNRYNDEETYDKYPSWRNTYRRNSSIATHSRDPFGRVFEGHGLDSTGADITEALITLYVM